MKPPNKAVITLITIPIVILLFFSSNIYGYFRFKSYCSNEGGLRVYEKLERNVGWMAEDKYDAKEAAQLKYVGFIRYLDKTDGKLYDLRYVGNNPNFDDSFERTPADESKKIRYRWSHINETVPNESRLAKSGYEILDFNSSRRLVRFYMFGYSRLEQSRTILAASSNIGCFHEATENYSPLSMQELNTSFKN